MICKMRLELKDLIGKTISKINEGNDCTNIQFTDGTVANIGAVNSSGFGSGELYTNVKTKEEIEEEIKDKEKRT